MKPTWGLVAALAVCSVALAGDKEDLAAYKKFVKGHAKDGIAEIKRRYKGQPVDAWGSKAMADIRRGTFKPPSLDTGVSRPTVGLIGSLDYDSGRLVKKLPNGDLVVHCESSSFRLPTGNDGRTVEVGGGDYDFVLRGAETSDIMPGDVVILPVVMRAIGREPGTGTMEVFERFMVEKPGDKLLDD